MLGTDDGDGTGGDLLIMGMGSICVALHSLAPAAAPFAYYPPTAMHCVLSDFVDLTMANVMKMQARV